MSEKKLILGNEAVARGLFEAGCRVVSSYPGTPSTEITEYVSKYDEIYSEWAPNEKVATEVAVGASFGGARAFCAMKHVGLNVAADPLFTASYTGVNGGLIICVADDPGMHSSQNEQDSRHYAIASKVPMVEPSDSQECIDFVKQAYEISENFDTPVILRMSTRVSHSQSIAFLNDRIDNDLKPYEKNPAKYVMVPANAKVKHVAVEQRTKDLIKFAETCKLNKIEYYDKKIGVITSGITYQYAKDALGENASYLKLGLVNPMPEQLIRDFAKNVDILYVFEELDDIIETHLAKLGIKAIGKELFSFIGEYSQKMIKEKIFGNSIKVKTLEEQLPVRPPVMCPGCPHRGLFYVLNKLKLTVSGDIGCYTLGAAPPLSAIDTTVCMGASISGLHGMNIARGNEFSKNSVAVIGDSTFIHSGITGLIDIAYNKGCSTIIILDNSITGMTGHQENPTTGKTIKGDPTYAVSLEKLCAAVGINRVNVVDPNNIEQCEKLIKQEVSINEPSVIITRRPCALLKYVKHEKPLNINSEKCKSCKKCLKIGCPAISIIDGKAQIDETLCVGCDLCLPLCPFDAIEKCSKEDK